MKKGLARKGAQWWADQLRNGCNLDNGDKSEAGFMAHMLGTIAQGNARKNMSNEAIDLFEGALITLLEAEKGEWVTVGVDYHPDRILQQAADSAGLQLSMGSLPWKTVMHFNDDSVKVSPGYRAEQITL